jgi:murein DD-endopeptidase MepM/ murein hydrolase activator NlpD
MKKKYVILVLAILMLLMSAATLYVVYHDYPTGDLSEVTVANTSKPKVNRLYGLAVDSFRMETGKIGRNQNLGQVLAQFNLPERSMSQLLQYAGNIFDLRKIRVGNTYTAFLSKDSISKLQYLVYEHSPVDYVVFDFNDSVKVSVKQKEITTIQKKVHGEIVTSLWDAITKSSISPQVALELSDIYAWTIDFFGLQPGDHFTVVYDELYVDSVSIGLGQIHGASFTHGGRDLLAIPFMQDSTLSYFDGDGNSLRRAFLKAPLRFSHISSRFSNSRMHPILKIRRPHHGVDYAAPIGTPVYSIGDGRVLSATYQGGEGRMVKIRHNGVYTTMYMHLSAFAKGIQSGTYVKQGDLIGFVGSSGLSTGPHLDFRVFKNGDAIDPLKMESPTVNPIKPENKMAFNTVKSTTVDILTGSQTPQLGKLDDHLRTKPLLIVNGLSGTK